MTFWEFAIIVVILVFLGSGIVQLAMKRQMEILKDYLLPRDTPLKRTILRPGKVEPTTPTENQDNLQEEQSEDETKQETVPPENPQTAEMSQSPVEENHVPQSVP